MLDTRSAFDYISLVDYANRLSAFLIITSAFGDQQNLTARMNVPIKLCSGTINGLSNTGVERAVSDIQVIQPDVPPVILKAVP